MIRFIKKLPLFLFLSVLVCYGQVRIDNIPFQSGLPELSGRDIKPNDAFDISFTIEPFYDVKIIRFIVILEFKGDKSGETRILLPGDFGGNNNLPGIKFLKPLSDNTTLVDAERSDQKIVKHPPGAQVKIYYQVQEIRNGDLEFGNHYMVVLNRKYFHFLGETFFIMPAWDSGNEYRFRITWNHMPSNWNLANSFGVNEKVQTVKLPLWKFRYTLFVGGDFRIVKRFVDNKPVYISLRGKWNFTDDQIADLTSSIISEERKFWDDYNQPYFLLNLLPVEGSDEQSGTMRAYSYGMFLSADRKLDYRFKRIIAHEIFHGWLGEKIQFAEPEGLTYWFREGFAEYYARLLLLRAGQISLAIYVDEYNKVLERYYKSSTRFDKNERVTQDFWTDIDVMRTPYFRGDIIAHNLNAAIKKNSANKKSLDNLMLDLLKRCQSESLVVSNGSLSALIRYYAGDHALSEAMRTLNSGVYLKANPEALGPCFKMEIESSRQFWLFGEKYDVPRYVSKDENQPLDNSCLEWFGVK